MLIVATTVFLYYTVWTLLMVTTIYVIFGSVQLTQPALRRPWPPLTRLVSSSSLGDPHTCHPDTARFCYCWILLERGDDQKQSQEDSQGEDSWKEEGLSGSWSLLASAQDVILPWRQSIEMAANYSRLLLFHVETSQP